MHQGCLFDLTQNLKGFFDIPYLFKVIRDHWSLIGVSRFFGDLFVEEFAGLPKTIRRIIRHSVWTFRSLFRVLGKAQGTGQGGLYNNSWSAAKERREVLPRTLPKKNFELKP